MNVFEAIKARRSVKAFDSDHQLSEQELRSLLTAAALAPTSFNMQNRHMVVVLDREVKSRLHAAAWGQEHVRDASAVIVLTGDLDAYKRTDRYLRDAPDEIQELLTPMITGFYGDNKQLLRDEACRSVSLAAMNLMLYATEMGYESCPVVGFNPVQVTEILNLDETHPPLLMVVIGKGTKDPQPRMGFLNFEEQVSIDRFGNHTYTGEVEF